MIRKIYIDTSVFGGYFDAEFDEQTHLFLQAVKDRNITVLVSNILELEIYRAPERVVDLFESLSSTTIQRIDLTDEVKQLANLYVTEKVVGKTSIADCQHIALATIYRADVLASWNFKHIVNLERIKGYNAINFREGYPMTEIRAPNEIFKDED